MNNLLVVICVVIFLFRFSTSWVFTDIKYNSKFDMVEDDAFPEARINYDENEVGIGQERINLIYPGTKWCGSGNVADDNDDLGSSKEADACCRDHDHCPDIIEAGGTKHNLTNNAYYTRLSCECDEQFRLCLRKANTKTARHVGKLYFNMIHTECFREEYPVTGCERHSGYLIPKCVKYTYNNNGKKRYQWFDVPNF